MNAPIGERIDWKFRYDDHDRLVTSVDPSGRPTRFQYDAAPDGALKRIAIAPPEGGAVSWNMNGGRVVEMHDAAGSVRYGYDALGNIVLVERGNVAPVHYAYDAESRMIEMRVGDAYRLAWTYDYLGRITSLTSPAGVVRYDYQPTEVQRTLPNGLFTFWKCDARGLLANITHGRPTQPGSTTYTPIATYDYQHDAEGLIATIQEQTASVVGRQNGVNRVVKQYAYSKTGRLITATGHGSNRYDYNYDEPGNRTKATITNGSAVRTQACAYDWAGRLVSVDGVPVKHDAYGNVTELTLHGVTRKYKYRPDGRLAEVRGNGNTTKYTYDGFGRLLIEETNQKRRFFSIDPLILDWHPLEIRDSDGTVTRVVWQGKHPLALIRADKVQWLLDDHNESARLLVDKSGTLVGSCDYDPFGVPSRADGAKTLPTGFAGLLDDLEAGGQLTLARVYVPELGRFLQPDPLKRMPSSSTEDTAVYAYCGNDPINYLDQTGAARSQSDVDKHFLTKDVNPWIAPHEWLDQWARPYGSTSWQGAIATASGLLPWGDRPVGQGQQWETLFAQGALLTTAFIFLPEELATLGTVGVVGSAYTYISSAARGQWNDAAWAAAGSLAYWGGAQFAQNIASSVQSSAALFFSNGIRDVSQLEPALQAGTISTGEAAAIKYLANNYTKDYLAASALKTGTEITDKLVSSHDIAETSQDIIKDIFHKGHEKQSETSLSSTSLSSTSLSSTSSVGGVALSGASKALSGLGQIQGVRVDANGNILLIGDNRSDIKLPALRMDDLVTIFRLVYLHGQGPTVTIDPNPAGPKNLPMLIKHDEVTEDTYVGWVLYEADRLMKVYTIGKDNISQQDFRSHISTYKAIEDAIFFSSQRQRSGGNWERFWIVPAGVSRFTGPRKELTIFDVPLKVNTQEMKWEGGKLVDDRSAPSSAGANAFKRWFGQNYDAIAAEQYMLPPPDAGIDHPVPVFTELRRIALITAIAEKLRDEGVPLPAWMQDYPVRAVKFEKTTPIIQNQQHSGSVTATITGGVDTSADPKVVRDFRVSGGSGLPDGKARLADRLETAAAQLPVSLEPFSLQEVRCGDQSYKMFVMPGARTRALHAAQLNEPDLVVKIPGGTDLRLIRSFHSFYASNGIWGPGWAFDMPTLKPIQVLQSREGDSRSYLTGYDLSTPLNSVHARFDTEMPVPENGGGKLLVSREEGPFLGIGEGQLGFWQTKGGKHPPTTLVLLKSGAMWHFSKEGALIATVDPVGQDRAQTTVYERNAEGKLSRLIAMVGQQAVAEIVLKYDHEHVTRAVARYVDNTSNSIGEVEYRYDKDGRLASAVSPSGEVAYAYQNEKVAQIYLRHLDEKNPILLRSIKYNPVGEVLEEKFEAKLAGQKGAETIRYGVKATSTGTESSAMTSGGRSWKRYDRQFLLVEAQTPEGAHVRIGYGRDGTLSEVSLPGGRVFTLKQSADSRTRTLTVPGTPPIRASYDTGGHLTGLFKNGQSILTQIWHRNGLLARSDTPYRSMQYQYDSAGQLLSYLISPHETGKLTSIGTQVRVNRWGNPINIIDSQGTDIDYRYDQAGKLIAKEDKSGGHAISTRISYDAQGRVERRVSTEQQRDMGQIAYQYDQRGGLSFVKMDRGGKSASLNYAAKRLLSVEGFDKGRTVFAYFKSGDVAGLLSDTYCANGLRIERDYDIAQRRITATAQERRIAASYDTRGRIIDYTWEQVTHPK